MILIDSVFPGGLGYHGLPVRKHHMVALPLRSHFDGVQILFDEPHDLRPGTPLATVILQRQSDLEKPEWIAAARSGLARRYGDEEPEYSSADVKQ
jgi:hypothetical protein